MYIQIYIHISASMCDCGPYGSWLFQSPFFKVELVFRSGLLSQFFLSSFSLSFGWENIRSFFFKKNDDIFFPLFFGGYVGKYVQIYVTLNENENTGCKYSISAIFDFCYTRLISSTFSYFSL